MPKHNLFSFVFVWSSFLIITSFSSGDINSLQPEVCIRFKLDQSMSARQAQAYFCSMLVPEGVEPAQFALSCMEEQGIKPTDEDMQGFLLGK